MMRHLGHDRFLLVGHDRGSLVALRLALDHPAEVMAIAILDGIPVSEHIRRTNAEFATRWWHWFFFAQPEVPERVINADPLAWYTAKMDPDVMGAENYDEITMAVRNPTTVRAMLEDYRAGLTVDLAHEEADRTAGRTVVPPMLALWSLRDDLEELHGNPVEIWKTWADDVRGWGIDSGHHMAEEALTEFFGARR
jgi:haloacetate dehalogenase